MRIFIDRDIYGNNILVSMNPDEYGMMCEFIKSNSVGYGRNRELSNLWRGARENFDKRKRTK